MAQTINLLPTELTRGKEVTKLASSLKVLDIILCAVLLVVGILGVGYTIILRNELTQATATRDDLKNKVLSLESSERQLVLLQDRLDKIAQIRAEDSVGELFDQQNKILAQVPEEVTLGDSIVDSGNSQLGVVSRNIAPLEALISNLQSIGYDRPLLMSSFSYNSFLGFKLVLNVK